LVDRVHKNSAYLDGKSTSGTTTRVSDTSCTSGMCPICIRDCPVLCEISLAAFRGREALYPDPQQYGKSTASALKDFGLDWSHFNIQSSLLGAEGIERDPTQASNTHRRVRIHRCCTSKLARPSKRIGHSWNRDNHRRECMRNGPKSKARQR